MVERCFGEKLFGVFVYLYFYTRQGATNKGREPRRRLFCSLGKDSMGFPAGSMKGIHENRDGEGCIQTERDTF